MKTKHIEKLKILLFILGILTAVAMGIAVIWNIIHRADKIKRQNALEYSQNQTEPTTIPTTQRIFAEYTGTDVRSIEPVNNTQSLTDGDDVAGSVTESLTEPVTEPPKPTLPKEDLTDPSVKPTYAPEQTATTTQPTTPKNGTTNEKGEVYNPVFGWIPLGTGNIYEDSKGSDGGDWDKQVGNMN